MRGFVDEGFLAYNDIEVTGKMELVTCLVDRTLSHGAKVARIVIRVVSSMQTGALSGPRRTPPSGRVRIPRSVGHTVNLLHTTATTRHDLELEVRMVLVALGDPLHDNTGRHPSRSLKSDERVSQVEPRGVHVELGQNPPRQKNGSLLGVSTSALEHELVGRFSPRRRLSRNDSLLLLLWLFGHPRVVVRQHPRLEPDAVERALRDLDESSVRLVPVAEPDLGVAVGNVRDYGPAQGLDVLGEVRPADGSVVRNAENEFVPEGRTNVYNSVFKRTLIRMKFKNDHNSGPQPR